MQSLMTVQTLSDMDSVYLKLGNKEPEERKTLGLLDSEQKTELDKWLD